MSDELSMRLDVNDASSEAVERNMVDDSKCPVGMLSEGGFCCYGSVPCLYVNNGSLGRGVRKCLVANRLARIMNEQDYT